MAVLVPQITYPEAVRTVRVQVGDEFIARSTSGEWTAEQAYWIAREMVAALCAGEPENDKPKDPS